MPVLVAAAISGREGSEKAKLLLEYADTVGLAFQIKDDILDVEGDSRLLGKATGSDAKDGKTTFVTIYGLEKSKNILKALTDQAILACEKLLKLQTGEQEKEACVFLRDLAIFLLERTY